MPKTKIGKHQKHEKDLKAFINRTKKNEHVDKIILGRCYNTRHSSSPGTVVFKKDISNGIQCSAYTHLGLRDIFIYCKSEFREVLKTKLFL